MYNPYKSLFTVLDATPEQHPTPLPLWGMACVDLWEKNEKDGNKYRKIELYQFVNYYPTENFKSKFFSEFKIYKESHPNGTIETFRKKEYQQFIYDCGDIIEMIEKQNYYYWTTVRGFDLYIPQMKGCEKAYLFEKNDIHEHEINLKALIQFLEFDCIRETPIKKSKTKLTLSPKFDDIDYQIQIIFDKTKEIFSSDITQWKNLFSVDIQEFKKPIGLNKNTTIGDLRLFLDGLHTNDLIKKSSFNKIIQDSKAFSYKGNLITADSLKHAKGGNYPNTLHSHIIRETFKSLNNQD